MNDRIDCTTDIKRGQAAQAITQCINSIADKMQLSVLELRSAVETVLCDLNRSCMELYATAYAEMAVQQHKERKGGDGGADLD